MLCSTEQVAASTVEHNARPHSGSGKTQWIAKFSGHGWLNVKCYFTMILQLEKLYSILRFLYQLLAINR